jgi:hypothetical protein
MLPVACMGACLVTYWPAGQPDLRAGGTANKGATALYTDDKQSYCCDLVEKRGGLQWVINPTLVPYITGRNDFAR